MKRVLIFLTVVAIAFGGVSSISEIKTQYSKIRNSLKTMQKIRKNLDDTAPEGAEAIIYKDKDGIKLIEVNSYFETGKVREEYYFKDGELFFFFKEITKYNAPPTTEYFDEKKSQITQERVYFVNGKIAKWIENKRVHTFAAKNIEPLFQKEKEVKSNLKELLNSLK